MGSKSPLESKTVHFNAVSAILVPAVWPFLPHSFRDQDWAIGAVTAWLGIGNIVLRFITKGAISWTKEKSKD